MRLVGESLRHDYTLLFAIPLVPWTMLLGEQRQVFVLGVFVTYFVPYLLCGAAIARALLPRDPRRAMGAAAVFLLATPAGWYHVPLGYPDVGGAALVASCALLYGLLSTRPFVAASLIGLGAGLSIVFRRHYIYAVMALFGAIAIDIVTTWMRSRKNGSADADTRNRLLILLLGTGVVSLVTGLMVPEFLRKAFAELGGAGVFASWESSVGHTLITIVATVGVLPLILAVGGWVSISTSDTWRNAPLRLVAIATLVWVVLWATWGRQEPNHYPHWLPLFVGLGLTALWLKVRLIPRAALRRVSQAGMAVLVGTALVLGFPLTLPTGVETRNPYPFRLVPDPIRPTVTPAFDELVRLVRWLRTIATPADPIVVAASSTTLNFDVLRAVEKSLYGRHNTRLDVVSTPQADSYGELPTASLLAASYVVVAKPFQYHLEPDTQKVVRVVLEAFDTRWPVAADFELLEPRFSLGVSGTEVRVQRRVRELTPEIVADTTRRVERYVYGSKPPGAPSVERAVSDAIAQLPRPLSRNAPDVVRDRPMVRGSQCNMESVNGSPWGAAPVTVSTGERNIIVTGWIVDDQTKASGDSVFLRLQSGDLAYYAEAVPTLRPDVVAVFSEPRYGRSGYRARVLLAGLQPGKYEAMAVMTLRDRALLCASGRYLVVE